MEAGAASGCFGETDAFSFMESMSSHLCSVSLFLITTQKHFPGTNTKLAGLQLLQPLVTSQVQVRDLLPSGAGAALKSCIFLKADQQLKPPPFLSRYYTLLSHRCAPNWVFLSSRLVIIPYCLQLPAARLWDPAEAPRQRPGTLLAPWHSSG